MKLAPGENSKLFWVVSVFTMLTVVAILVPLLPLMPKTGLDPSWRFAINRAAADGVAFGRDLIFTFGPYAAVYTELYTPGTDQMTLAGSLFLSVFYVAVILIVFYRRNAFLMLAFTYILTILILRDALLESYALLLSLVLHRLTAPRQSADGLGLSPWLFVFLCAPLGFLPLIKGTILPLTGSFVALYSVFLWWNGLRAIAICTVASPIVTAVLAWTIAGQSIENLPMYALTMLPIISGYTDAMATSGDTIQINLDMASCRLYHWRPFVVTQTPIGFAAGRSSFYHFRCSCSSRSRLVSSGTTDIH